ncbi:MAG TPA: DUF6600 domain-containing protein [Acidobacteriaceae bacterium]|nr:DUF6600 domain-containing protein [Acidobacteriaceae bacterium]
MPDTPADATSTDEQPAQPVSNVRAVRLSDVEGVVKVYQGDQIAFDQAQPNMPAVEGMRFVTGGNGRLEIELEDGSVARLAPNSSMRLTRLSRSADGTTITQFDALTGLSYYELSAHAGQVSVHFDTDSVTPIDSAVFRISLDAAPNELAVMHGAVHVGDGEALALDVHPNQTFQIDPQQPGEYTVAQSLTANSWDQWNSDRDEALAKLESSETTARASVGNPDDAAWSDLDYYGNWYDLPGYGQVWAPAGVDASWDPFGNGYWGYYPSLGYTWISGYPWGWWPYHCGAWDFVGGWGWIWIPGNCGWGFWGAGWYPYATVWGMPRGYVPPLRPRHGPGLHGPRPAPLIAVNRGPQFGQPFRNPNPIKGQPRVLTFDGKVITPLQAGIHPVQRGPLRESFTSALVRTRPEMAPEVQHTAGFVPGNPAGPGARTLGPAPGAQFPRINPGGPVRGYTPPPGTIRAAPVGGGHVYAPPAAGGSVHVGGSVGSPGGAGGHAGGGAPPAGGGGAAHGSGGGTPHR